MRAMILAAGRGQRMRDLTDHFPKPLVKINGRYLIEYSIDQLKKNGMTDIVINICYGADQIKKTLGNGVRYGVNIHYSEEAEALETGGGIVKALPLLGNDPFVVISADIITDYPLSRLSNQLTSLAHLVLVDNPTYHLEGDFSLQENKLSYDKQNRLTYASIGIYHPDLFKNYSLSKFTLNQVFKNAIPHHQITGEYYQGLWCNIGTPEDLEKAKELINSF